MLFFFYYINILSYASISKKFKNQDDFLEVTTHLSDENAVMINERRR